MTTCADSTLLRTHLDHPDPALDAHLDDCQTCVGLLHSVADDAGFARRMLSRLDPVETEEPLDVDGALATATARSEAAPGVPLAAPAGRARPRDRRHLLAAAAAIVVVAVAVTPPGRSAIAATLDAFRGERLQVITVDLDSWATAPVYEGLRALETVGDVDLTEVSEPREVADVAEAENLSGINAPALPRQPERVAAMAPGTVRIELDRRDRNGVPAELDGATLVVDVPGAIVTVFGPADGPPELVVGRSGPLVARAEGAPLEDIRSFLLSLDELPDDLRRQLAAIHDWRSTIPVPVPLDGPGWEEVEVAGRPALAFGDDSGIAAMVLRQDAGGGVTVVGGRLTVTQALALAADA